MATPIKFGTSGWRAIVADEFTVANVKRAVTVIARYVAETGKSDPKLVVGRDPRFMGETFVEIAAKLLEDYGITPLVISEAAPTPAIAPSAPELRWAVRLGLRPPGCWARPHLPARCCLPDFPLSRSSFDFRGSRKRRMR